MPGTRRLALLVVALLLALSGCTSGAEGPGSSDGPSADASTTSTAEPEPTPEPEPEPEPTTEPQPVRRPELPPESACYRMGLAQATRPTTQSRPVPCREPHTAQTVFVGRLDLSPAGRRLRVDSPAVQRRPAEVCPVQLRRYVGGTTDVRRRSRFEVVWFTPTLEQADRGARWFRCDAVAVLDDDRLQRLPLGPRLRGILDRPGALATYGLCGTARPGAPGFRRVACALPHSWEAISTIDLPGGARYPGTAQVRTAGDETCADQVRDRSGVVLSFSYGWEWPTRAQWTAGQHYGYCWAPTG